MLKIIDNGSGIGVKDFELVCERFATSKLQKQEDLMEINSFGFRGEALASLSFVSHLQLFSKPNNQDYGFTAKFRDGFIFLILIFHLITVYFYQEKL
ncbi:MAG: ATP-binding protein [bacterium]